MKSTPHSPNPEGFTEVLHDEATHRFYIPLGAGQEAHLLYERRDNILDFYHTAVPSEVRERGLAERIVEAGFRYAQQNGLKVIPSCSYVSQAFLRRRKEFLPLVAGGVKRKNDGDR